MKKLQKWTAIALAAVIGLMTALEPIGVKAAETVTAADTSETASAEITASDVAAYQAVFDAAYYYCRYPDVAAAFGADYNLLLQHYISDGAKNGRSASAEFNLQYYKERYSDLQAAFGDDLAAYARHYIQYGKAEGRVANREEEKETDVSGAPAELSGAGQVIGTCTTIYTAGVQRAINVELATSRINGVTLQPGEEFSYNIAVLPRTAANGYVTATVFINGTTGQGIGGGICQVSSTLYAAMLNAGLPATERHPHSLPVSYLPAGYDATIAGNTKDLKFVNIYDRPLQIRASAVSGTLTVSLVLL